MSGQEIWEQLRLGTEINQPVISSLNCFGSDFHIRAPAAKNEA
jgi:hypothetical protein